MENKEQTNSNEREIQALIGRYLHLRSSNEPAAANAPHMDDDQLSAFTEGNLSQREARPIVSHLVDCSYCRHITADLVRLDFALAETEPTRATAATSEPSRVSEALSGLLARIFGTSGSAVFAHEEPKKDEGEDDKKKEKEDDN
jgi:hypothetical protein